MATLKETFHKLVEKYDENNSQANLDAIKSFLKLHFIYFSIYYNNTEGRDPVRTSNYQVKGKFLDFTESTQFQVPDLLTVQKEDGEIVYVSLNEFTFE